MRPRRLYAACTVLYVVCLSGAGLAQPARVPVQAATQFAVPSIEDPLAAWKIEEMPMTASSGDPDNANVETDGAVPTPKWRLRRATPGDAPAVFTGSRRACEWRRYEELLKAHGSGRWNIRAWTLGGKQLWGDELVFAGWRIQRGTLTGHYRLLDDRNVRRAWGSFAACRTVLEGERLRCRLQHRSAQAVVLLHGLGRSKASLAKLRDDCAKAGYTTVDITYPSTRGSLQDHAAQVGRVLERLDGVTHVSFVTHSLGGLVARTLLAQNASAWRQKLTVDRVVMIAPPSRGSWLADQLADQLWFQPLLGAAATGATSQQASDLPCPSCDFAVIAGGTGTTLGKNLLIPGDNDGLLRVETTRLPGGAFLKVNARHRTISAQPAVRTAVLRFLRTGKFEVVPEQRARL